MAYRLIFVNFIEQIRPKGPSPSKIMRAHFLIGELSWGLAIYFKKAPNPLSDSKITFGLGLIKCLHLGRNYLGLIKYLYLGQHHLGLIEYLYLGLAALKIISSFRAMLIGPI